MAAIRMAGKEWNAFYIDKSVWDGRYHDDTSVAINGVSHESSNVDLDKVAALEK